MKQITQLNVETLNHDSISGVNPNLPISFHIGRSRYDVKINDDGSLNIYHISLVGNDPLAIVPISCNVVTIRTADTE